MRIQTNISSLNAIESGTNNSKSITNSLEKLSSGLSINKASDDASGLAIADKLRTQVSSITQSIDNANSAVAMIQIADKAMGEQSNILDIVKMKLIQSSTETTSSEGRKAVAKDINKLLEQFNNIAGQTNYNGVYLLQASGGSSGSSPSSSMVFQIGETLNDTIQTSGTIQSNTSGLATGTTLTLANLKAASSGDGSGLTQSDSSTFLKTIDTALSELNTMRANFGSTQNQIEAATRNMMTQKTNIAAAESVIRDVDFAEESARLNKLNIIGNASTYAQSQANAVPQSILKLLN